MKRVVIGVLIGLFVSSLAFAAPGPAEDLSAIGEKVSGAIQKANESLLKNEREAAAKDLEDAGKFVGEQATKADEATRGALENVGKEIAKASDGVKAGTEKSLDELSKVSDYWMKGGVHLLKAQGAVAAKDYKNAQAELEAVSSYLGETAAGVGEQAKGKFLNVKDDVDKLAATTGESTVGTAQLTTGTIAAVGDHIVALFKEPATEEKAEPAKAETK